MFKFFFKILLTSTLLCVDAKAQAIADTTEDSQTPKTTVYFDSLHMFRIGVDASKFVLNAIYDTRKAYEVSLDWYRGKERYWVLDAGIGESIVDYPDLNYKSDNVFVRLGFDKGVFKRKKATDWGGVFWGLRYGLSRVNRHEATYYINDGLGGVGAGVIDSKAFMAHWGELALGMRLELLNNVFAGWTIRMKLMLNPKASGDLHPSYIAGYGNGEKSTAFDYNFYLLWSIKWAKRNP